MKNISGGRKMQFQEKSVEIRNQLTIEVNSEKHRTDNGIIIKLAMYGEVKMWMGMLVECLRNCWCREQELVRLEYEQKLLSFEFLCFEEISIDYSSIPGPITLSFK
jgi:hypothetical protein